MINTWASGINLKVSKKKIGKQIRLRGGLDRAGDSDVISVRDSWFMALGKNDRQNRKDLKPIPSTVRRDIKWKYWYTFEL